MKIAWKLYSQQASALSQPGVAQALSDLVYSIRTGLQANSVTNLESISRSSLAHSAAHRLTNKLNNYPRPKPETGDAFNPTPKNRLENGMSMVPKASVAPRPLKTKPF